jgi:hypothetical protein
MVAVVVTDPRNQESMILRIMMQIKEMLLVMHIFLTMEIDGFVQRIGGIR